MNKDKLDEILSAIKRRDDSHRKNKILWVLAVIGTIAAVVGIAYAVYRFFAPDYLDEFEEDDDEDYIDEEDAEEDIEDEIPEEHAPDKENEAGAAE